MTRSSRLLLVSAVGLVILIGGLAAMMLFRSPQITQAVRSLAPIGGPFTLTASDGRTVTERTYRGKWVLIYFGYTNCPDECPLALNDVGVALDRLGPEAAAVQPLFITVDPMRDTREVLSKYLKSFDPHIVGLTGTEEQIAAVAKEFRVYYAHQGKGGQDYVVDHSSFFYLFGPQGQFVDVMAADLSGEGIAARVSHFMKPTSSAGGKASGDTNRAGAPGGVKP
jgi:protein SCO1/2